MHAGFSMRKRQFFSNISTICLLAVFGTIIATFITGAILSKIGYMPASECFVFAALISAVDPVATLSVFQKLKAPDLLFNLVFGESVLNDAVAIVLYQIFHGFSKVMLTRLFSTTSNHFNTKLSRGLPLQLQDRRGLHGRHSAGGAAQDAGDLRRFAAGDRRLFAPHGVHAQGGPLLNYCL
jgi:hypothetical protein